MANKSRQEERPTNTCSVLVQNQSNYWIAINILLLDKVAIAQDKLLARRSGNPCVNCDMVNSSYTPQNLP